MTKRKPSVAAEGEYSGISMASIQQLEDRVTQVLQLAPRGWQLFPVKPRGKEPLISNWPGHATADPSRLTFWAKRFSGCNWAVATGPQSGVFVLDVDGEEGRAAIQLLFDEHGTTWAETLTVKTSRGWHLYFRWPESSENIRNSAGKLSAGLDIRGDGGYAIVPPSIHSSGAAYEFAEEDALILPAPAWLLEACVESQRIAQEIGENTELKKAATIPKGQRNDALARLAGAMRRKGFSLQAIEAALLAENKSRCEPPLNEDEVHEIAGSICRYSPAANNGKGTGMRRADIVTLAKVQAREVDWLWKPYLAYGTLAMLSGDPGAGKTFIAQAIAAAITIGEVPYTKEPRIPGHVLYLSVENSAECVLRPRFDQLGGNPELFHLLEGFVIGEGESAERGSVELSDTTLLRDAMRQKNPRLVVVDPIQSYLGAQVDAHRANETRPVLDGLARLAVEFQCCILLLRHLSKSQTGRAIHRGLGSIDLTGAVRTEMIAGTASDGSSKAMVQVKNNLGRFGKSLGYTIDEDGTFHWTGESSLTSTELLAAESSSEDGGALAEAEEFLREVLRGGPRQQKEIKDEAKQAGIAERTLRRAKERLGIAARKCGMHAGWEWNLPEDGQT